MLAAAAGVLWGCGDDPLAEGAGDNLALTGDPTALFITINELERMVVQLQDDQGTAVQTEFAVSNVTSGITVEVDESFVPVFSPDGELLPPTSPTRVRLEITAGNSPGVESFDVTAEGVTRTFSVRVVPTAFAGTFDAPMVLLDTVTLTATAPFGFAPDAEVHSPAGVVYEVVEVAVDGSSITFIPSSVEAGALTIEGATLSYISGATFTFNTADESGVASPFTDQDDPTATAPAIAAPAAVGDSVVFHDGGAIATDQFYRVTIPGAGTYQFILSWDGDADEDMYVCNADCSVNLSAFQAATGANPETANVVFAGGGDFTVYVQLYDAHDDIPENFKVIVKRTL
jgi:hypothetical protein